MGELLQCSPMAEMRAQVEKFLEQLEAAAAVYFPIRHHSPACAWHLSRLIEELRPEAVLIEGPEEMTSLIPYMLHEQTIAPFAVYATYAPKSPNDLPVQFASYYPFCDYSPELVALRTGQKVGARLRFIDLSYPEQIVAEGSTRQNLLDEHYLIESAYLKRLQQVTGCKDLNDTWDHLFEANFLRQSTREFIRSIAAYCYICRSEYSKEQLYSSLKREEGMARAIQEELARSEGRVIVVTGGFHTVALPLLEGSKFTRQKHRLTKSHMTLMAYSYDRLDALNGYSSGLPSPAYYDTLWQSLTTAQPFYETAGRLLVEIGRETRKTFSYISTADVQSALEQAVRMARKRGHTEPLREDLLDAVRSCFVKGDMEVEGRGLMQLVQSILSGNRTGTVPAEAGVPPLVEDFRTTAHKLRLKISDTSVRKVSLDIYRNSSHLHTSRFLHALNFLGVAFASLLSGPDFLRGQNLDRIQEQWEYRWTPLTESRLIERSVYGATIKEVATKLLLEEVRGAASKGNSRSAIRAVRLLVAACRMGLHEQTSKLCALITAEAAADPDFSSLSAAICEMSLLWHSREPLQARGLQALPTIARTAYHRAIFLIPSLATATDELAPQLLQALCELRETAISSFSLDLELLHEGLCELIATPQCHPLIAGGVAGLLYNSAAISSQELMKLLQGYLDSPVPAFGPRFLCGLLSTSREVAWNEPTLLRELDSRLRQWEEEQFLQHLPDLRLAFSVLTPREIDLVAQAVATLYGKPLGKLFSPLTLAQAKAGQEIERLVSAWLERDGLGGW